MHRNPLIFDISRGRIDDGDGIRTVIFLKGCPLSCTWCHNPEAQKFCHEFMWDNKKCVGCCDCIKSCSRRLVEFDRGRLSVNTLGCMQCMKCISSCPSGALRKVGENYSTDEVASKVLVDMNYYTLSGGGVTFSGGEPLCFPEYVGKTAAKLKEYGVSCAVETCGCFDYESFQSCVLPYIDCVLYDIKLISAEQHFMYTGVDNKRILGNLTKLSEEKIKIIPRTPVIPDITNSEENIFGIKKFLEKLGLEDKHILLPYNSSGKIKSEKLIGVVR